MKKSFTTTLVLLGCFGVLLAWYLVYEQKLRPQHEQADEKSKSLISLDRTAITDVTIERAKNVVEGAKEAPETEKIQVKKTGADWTLTVPIDYPADFTIVDSLLTTATTTHYDRVVEEKPKDLDAFGLKNPLLKVTFRKDASTPPQEIWVGNDTPTGSSCYVKLSGGDKVYRAPRVVHTGFDKDVKALRSKIIVDMARTVIAEVDIASGKEDIVMRHSDRGDTWTLAREGLPADATEWVKTLNAILDTHATDFVDSSALSKYGLQPPAAKVTLIQSGDNKKKLELWLGKAGDKFYAKRTDKPTIFVVDKDLLTKVQQPSSTYIEKRIAQFNRFDTTHLRVTRGAEVVDLIKNEKDSSWKFVDDDKNQVDKAKLDTLLTGLQDMKAAKFLKGKADVKTAALTVQIWEKADKPETPRVTLKFAAPQGKEIVGQLTGLGVPFSITEADWKKIDLGKADLTLHVPDSKSAAQAPDKKKS